MSVGKINALFGVLLGATGLYLALAGPSAASAFGVTGFPPPGGGAVDVAAEWRLVAFLRMFGAALALTGVALWAIGNHLDGARVRVFATAVACASGFGFLMAWSQQSAIWNTTAGAALTGLLGLMALAYGWVVVRGVAEARKTTASAADGAPVPS